MTDDTVLDEVLAQSTDAPDETDPSWTPALPALRAQQQDLRDRLRAGFEDRQSLLMWAHAVGAVSAGHVRDAWYRELLTDRWAVAACLTDESAREQLTDHPPTRTQGASLREDIIQEDLSAAFQAALKELRKHAGDYTDDEDGVDNVERQRFLGMRPRLHQVAIAQKRALEWALGNEVRIGGVSYDGFDSRSDVLDWGEYVVFATTGLVPDGFGRRVASPLSDWYAELTRDGSSVWLEMLLAEEVMPAMNAALRDAVKSAEEAPRTFDSTPDVDPRPTEAY
jgi:hypothetical protein